MEIPDHQAKSVGYKPGVQSKGNRRSGVFLEKLDKLATQFRFSRIFAEPEEPRLHIFFNQSILANF